ncbi:bifunctional diaminohydroxyphosphoribosylaminopyrimidine deaminase/5-amino-6-(5-phosphoribosylamino)uracil reductase RibD [Polaribacter dokdonensis]|uniref:bifunctional diaminohydroxyphosphoribosylaminopyrimidine deaminase/5-amino-6-(5-phosphoribosylamino)uracil reductase RibD n=1 Tax=Polaribacter dokdonensis TaxID=326329 RepID=UPI0006B57AC2|nr:bifunctional diaminohydroxyphosphoribosylaminopyrimidine deaminase/5-amino-6-(5-phosphoribosylamino)uracil reductase RibD [Polaribacter dokdonensis]
MNHEVYIKRCLQIAKNGLGTTRPNPSVGAVIVHNNKIIAEGFTSNYGSNHAEVNAITAVLDKSLLKEATIYVTLEPCSHFGKTPPCADLIVKHNFKKVVIGTLDTNSMVAGKGVERLKNAGIEVIVGVLEEECKKHHKRFFTNQNKKRPYTILKWAESQDGFIAPNYKEKQQPVWISNQYSQQIVHKLRSKEHAILVGTNTVIADNPKLNVRSWTGNNPTRVVLDNHLRLPKSLHVFDNSVKTIFITDKNTDANSKQENMVFEKIDFQNNVAKQIISILQKHKIQSLIVEGGAKTLQTFIDENLWDEAMVFVGDVELKEGVKGPEFDVQLAHQQKIKNDTLKVYIND